MIDRDNQIPLDATEAIIKRLGLKNLPDGFCDFGWLYADMVERFLSRDPLSVRTFVEIGTYHARSAIIMGALLVEQGALNTRFYTVDLYEGGEWSANPEDLAVNWHVLYVHGFEFVVDVFAAGSLKAAAHFPPSSVDFCFIDGDHSCEGCGADILAWWPKIRKGGVLAGHDYTRLFPGVVRAVDELFGQGDTQIPGVLDHENYQQSMGCWIVTK